MTDLPGNKKPMVLVVDDEEINRTVLAELLEAAGYDSATVQGGAEAVALYTDRHREIDIILLDLVMPGMGGRETFINLREIDSQAKIILISGYSTNPDIEYMKEKGLSAVLGKPYRFSDLEQILREVLEG